MTHSDNCGGLLTKRRYTQRIKLEQEEKWWKILISGMGKTQGRKSDYCSGM
ncbi:hypothetical protein J9T78_004432 [Salmonella enterica]|nr:hypothetical protein [Salmonella enterica]EHO4426067.1 hypothetical protein [Salmonella enterica]